MTYAGHMLQNSMDPELSAQKHVFLHATRWSTQESGRVPLVIERGQGIRLFDVHGKSYIDGLAGLFVAAVGHGRREIGEAMAEQAGKLAYVSPSTLTSLPAVELAELLAELTPGDLNRIYFCSGGSEAVETALKMAKQVQVMRGFAERKKIIARRGGYHGSTFGAMSVTSTSSEKYYGPFMQGTSFIESPNRYRNPFGLEGEEGDLRCADALEEEILRQGPDTVAAFIAEPVSASNGTHVPSPGYWKRIRSICDKYGVFLIADEVICGFGRTGRMFAMEHFGVVPDFMTMAKGLSSGYAAIAAVAVSDRIFESYKQKDEALGHTLTFGGNPIACAAALKNIEIMRNEELVRNSAATGAYMHERLRDLLSHPTVGDVRGIGLLFSIDLVKNKETKEPFGDLQTAPQTEFIKCLSEALLRNGLIGRLLAEIQLSPPLIISRAEVEEIVQILDTSLSYAEAATGYA